jgi:hypothetical protein
MPTCPSPLSTASATRRFRGRPRRRVTHGLVAAAAGLGFAGLLVLAPPGATALQAQGVFQASPHSTLGAGGAPGSAGAGATKGWSVTGDTGAATRALPRLASTSVPGAVATSAAYFTPASGTTGGALDRAQGGSRPGSALRAPSGGPATATVFSSPFGGTTGGAPGGAWPGAVPGLAPAAVATSGSGAADGAVFLVRPARLDLSSGAAAVELWVDGAPDVVGFQLELSFDPALALVTAVEAGAFLSSTGGTVILTPGFADDGTLVMAGMATLAEGMPAPSGSGVLGTVTFAPITSGGPVPLALGAASLVGVGGEEVPVARTVGGEVVVSVPPSEAMQTEAVAQATALAEAMPGGGPDLALPDLSEHASELIWLGLLLMACAVVAVGWLIGRRPPGPGDYTPPHPEP